MWLAVPLNVKVVAVSFMLKLHPTAAAPLVFVSLAITTKSVSAPVKTGNSTVAFPEPSSVTVSQTTTLGQIGRAHV